MMVFFLSVIFYVRFTRTIQSSRLLVSACNLFRKMLILLDFGC
jgi:hypothetical protein